MVWTIESIRLVNDKPDEIGLDIGYRVLQYETQRNAWVFFCFDEETCLTCESSSAFELYQKCISTFAPIFKSKSRDLFLVEQKAEEDSCTGHVFLSKNDLTQFFFKFRSGQVSSNFILRDPIPNPISSGLSFTNLNWSGGPNKLEFLMSGRSDSWVYPCPWPPLPLILSFHLFGCDTSDWSHTLPNRLCGEIHLIRVHILEP